MTNFLDSLPAAETRPVMPVAESVTEPVAGLPAETAPADATPAETAPAEAAPAAETTPAEAAEEAAKPAEATQEAQPAAEHVAAEAPAVNAELETARAALLEAAAAFGIEEKDLSKIPALIAEQRAKAQESAEATQVQEREQQWSREAAASLEPLANELIGANLRAEGFEIPPTVEAWELPENADVKARYFEMKAELATRPDWEQRYQEAYAARQAAYTDEQAKLGEFNVKYPQHSADLVGDLRKFGATPALLERVAQLTHTQVERAVSTLNSEMAAKDAELTTLRAKVSGHEAALAAARIEGQNAAIEEVKKGLAHPATSGLGGPPQDQAAGYKAKGSIGFFDIPSVPN